MGRVDNRSVREKGNIPNTYRLQSRPFSCTNFFETNFSEGLPQCCLLPQSGSDLCGSLCFSAGLLHSDSPPLEYNGGTFPFAEPGVRPAQV